MYALGETSVNWWLWPLFQSHSLSQNSVVTVASRVNLSFFNYYVSTFHFSETVCTFIHLIAHRKISLILKCIEWNQSSTYISEHGSLTRCTRTTLSRLFCLGKTRIYQGQKSYNSDKSYQYQSSSPPSRSLPQVSPYQENRSAKQHGEHLNFGSKHGWINQLMGIWIRILGVEARVPARQDSRWES